MHIFKLKFLLLITLTMVFTELPSHARHKCPKTPAPPGLLGITTLPTLLPSGTFMAAARSSNTSGCNKAHPSADFYRPKKEAVQQFIEKNHKMVIEETAKGKGPHLEVLSMLSGCKNDESVFIEMLKNHHKELFPKQILNKDPPQFHSSVESITEMIFQLKSKYAHLFPNCLSS